MIALLEACRGAIRADIYTSGTWVRYFSHEKICEDGLGAVHPWVSADELPAIFKNHDCLLSIGELRGRQLSSKIFSYMASGKPIVHIYHAADDANLAYLRRYPLALCLRDDPTLREENVRLLCRFILWSRGRRLAFDEVREIMPECTPDYVARQVLATSC